MLDLDVKFPRFGRAVFSVWSKLHRRRNLSPYNAHLQKRSRLAHSLSPFLCHAILCHLPCRLQTVRPQGRAIRVCDARNGTSDRSVVVMRRATVSYTRAKQGSQQIATSGFAAKQLPFLARIPAVAPPLIPTGRCATCLRKARLEVSL